MTQSHTARFGATPKRALLRNQGHAVAKGIAKNHTKNGLAL